MTGVSSPFCKNISVFIPPKSLLELFVSHPTRGAFHDRHERGVGCGGAAAFCARWDRRAGSQGLVSDQQHADERCCSRTAKSCGPDAPTLASSFAEFCRPNRAVTKRYPRDDGGKRARSPGRARHKLLKPLRAGMPGVPVYSLLLVCVLPIQTAHEAAGATGTRHSPRPPGGERFINDSGALRCEGVKLRLKSFWLFEN